MRERKGVAVCVVLSLVMVVALTAVAQDTKAMRNADVVELVKAALPETTIIMSIERSATAFDVSPTELIRLKNGGVPTKVIEAMIQATNRPTAAAVPAAAVPAAPGVASLWGSKQTRIDADRVFLLEGDKRTELKYTKPGTRSRFIYAIQTFAVLPGTKSRLRIETKVPEFEMILPDNVEISSIVALALLAERENGTREILIGGGFMSFSQGLPKERNMKIAYEKTADQSGAPEGYEIYRIKPAMTLKPGEYAFMVSKPAGGTMGPIAGAGFNYNFYEIGID